MLVKREPKGDPALLPLNCMYPRINPFYSPTSRQSHCSHPPQNVFTVTWRLLYTQSFASQAPELANNFEFWNPARPYSLSISLKLQKSLKPNIALASTMYLQFVLLASFLKSIWCFSVLSSPGETGLIHPFSIILLTIVKYVWRSVGTTRDLSVLAAATRVAYARMTFSRVWVCCHQQEPLYIFDLFTGRSSMSIHSVPNFSIWCSCSPSSIDLLYLRDVLF